MMMMMMRKRKFIGNKNQIKKMDNLISVNFFLYRNFLTFFPPASVVAFYLVFFLPTFHYHFQQEKKFLFHDAKKVIIETKKKLAIQIMFV